VMAEGGREVSSADNVLTIAAAAMRVNGGPSEIGRPNEMTTGTAVIEHQAHICHRDMGCRVGRLAVRTDRAHGAFALGVTRWIAQGVVGHRVHAHHLFLLGVSAA
jgi:hypothetical protein